MPEPSTSQTIIAIATLAAVFFGPIVALRLQRWLDDRRESRSRKLAIFKTLMAYRATILAPTFVQSLNLIDVEFNASSDEEKAVRNAWKVLLDHLGDPQASSPALEKQTELLTKLLLAMGKCLGYDFDEVQIKKGAYYPVGHSQVEQELQSIRREFLEVLSGKRRFPVAVFEDKFAEIKLPPADAEVPQNPVNNLPAG